MTVHKDMFDKGGNEEEGICELCGSPTVCIPCVGDGAPTPRATYFKCESCSSICESSYESSAYPNMCEDCETKVYEFYGAVITEGDTLGRDVRGEE